MRNQTSRIKHPRSASGFSLLEVLISIVLVGLSITAMVVASNSFTMANGAGADLSTAEFLIEQIRERTALMPVDNLSGLNGVTFSPPVGSDGTALTSLSAFSQSVVVQCVSQSNFSTVVTSSNFIRISVTVSLNGRSITSASWMRTRY